MSLKVYRKLLELLEKGEPAVLVTVVKVTGSVSGKPGFKMLVDRRGETVGTVGGGLIESTALREARRAMTEGYPRQFTFELTPEKAGGIGMLCGGETTLLIEPLVPPAEMIIFGAGHVAQPLAAMGKMLGFVITVMDDREEFCNRQRFPEADRLLVNGLEKITDKLTLHGNSYVVIVTRGHAGDQLALEQTLRSPVRYLGMIGSQGKTEAIFNNLRKKGFTNQELARVHSPIGLNIGAQTPPEIALSICAEIVKVKYGQAVVLEASGEEKEGVL